MLMEASDVEPSWLRITCYHVLLLYNVETECSPVPEDLTCDLLSPHRLRVSGTEGHTGKLQDEGLKSKNKTVKSIQIQTATKIQKKQPQSRNMETKTWPHLTFGFCGTDRTAGFLSNRGRTDSVKCENRIFVLISPMLIFYLTAAGELKFFFLLKNWFYCLNIGTAAFGRIVEERWCI